MPVPRYIRELRALIGTRFLLLASVTAAIFDERGRLLVVRITGRGDEFWTFPGGLIEPDERPIDALVREVREETGLDVRPTSIVGVHGGPEFRHTHASGDETGYVMTTCMCEVLSGVPRIDGDEIEDLRWVTRDEAIALPSGPWFPIVVRAAFEAHAPSQPPSLPAPLHEGARWFDAHDSEAETLVQP